MVLFAGACVAGGGDHGAGQSTTGAVPGPTVTSADARPDAAWTSRSQGGRYRVSIGPESGSVELGSLQSWWVRFETLQGRAYQPAHVAFRGAMPQHGHGFDTAPRVTEILGEGEVRIEGVRFHMAGDWRLRVDFLGPGGRDTAFFDVRVEH